MHKESGGEDITGSGGVQFVGGIGRESLGNTVLEEGGAVSPVGGDEQGNLHAPLGQDGIRVDAVAIGEWEQVVVAEYENVEKWQDFFSRSPGSGPNTTIVVPAPQPALWGSRDDSSRAAREESD
jgi:hypothetical protein